MPPLWDQKDKNYHKRDLKPNLWDEIGEKLNVTGKYWNNTNEIRYYLFRYIKCDFYYILIKNDNPSYDYLLIVYFVHKQTFHRVMLK